MPSRQPSVLHILRDAAFAAVASAALGLGLNAVRASPLPLVQREPYALLVPCPDAQGEVAEVAPSDPLLSEPGTLAVDARSKDDFSAWHLLRAQSLPYDFLEPLSKEAVKSVAESGARRVAVYGDGSSPDSGRELAKELASKGIRNVLVVKGGAPALRPVGGTP